MPSHPKSGHCSYLHNPIATISRWVQQPILNNTQFLSKLLHTIQSQYLIIIRHTDINSTIKKYPLLLQKKLSKNLHESSLPTKPFKLLTSKIEISKNNTDLKQPQNISFDTYSSRTIKNIIYQHKKQQYLNFKCTEQFRGTNIATGSIKKICYNKYKNLITSLKGEQGWGGIPPPLRLLHDTHTKEGQNSSFPYPQQVVQQSLIVQENLECF
eukprot:TRINITY_DN9715_c0_g4_i3.p1 TRINITY_DN9715_c0_g4~~TRINITY_DN9715_c0_g4_i3.p1  ORF type:complete len:212 (+),score=-0.34 TRINITY_DN9715_c0_g4_i3:146-781(+)